MILFILQHIKEKNKSDIGNDNPIQLLMNNHNSHISIQDIMHAKEKYCFTFFSTALFL